MKTYIGVKVVQAVPAKMVNGCIWPEGLPLPEKGPEGVHNSNNENVCSVEIREGYCFQREGDYPYADWMPKDDFEKVFRSAENLTFGDALEAVKRGKRAARKGWNGKGMFIFLAEVVKFHTRADLSEFEDQDVEASDMLVLRTAQGTFQPGWLASQADMLADDWYIVE